MQHIHPRATVAQLRIMYPDAARIVPYISTVKGAIAFDYESEYRQWKAKNAKHRNAAKEARNNG